MKYGARLKFSDGDLLDVEGEYDSRDEAYDAALEEISAYNTGCDILSYCDYDGDEPKADHPRIYIRKLR